MSSTSYDSAGVFSTETDLSQPTIPAPSGVPAGIIGTAETGPAFVPITVRNYESYTKIFGVATLDPVILGRASPTLFGPLAVYTYLESALALTYCRVLGVGDGLRRSTATGKVTRAGYVTGDQSVQANGLLGDNPFAVAGDYQPAPSGRTYFLACLMSESNGSRVFSEAGLQVEGEDRSVPILRGVILAPSGVIPHLSGNFDLGSGAPSTSEKAIPGASTMKGSATGSVNLSSGEFVLLLNGMTDASKNVITASFDMTEGNYFRKVLNTDPTQIEAKGHLLYSSYDIEPAFAVMTGSGVTAHHDEHPGQEQIGFIVSGSNPRNGFTANVSPNYESFEDRFRAPRTPFFTSQAYGSTVYNLFRIHSRGDGSATNGMYKVSIKNIVPHAENASYKYGTFDVLVRGFNDSDYSPDVLESHLGCNLDPTSEKYIARVIGDRHTFFDFDQALGSQKLVTEGDHPGNSTRVRVKLNPEIDLGNIPEDAVPFGFRGPDHLVTSGSGPLATYGFPGTALTQDCWISGTPTPYNRIVEPPIRYRKDVRLSPSSNNANSVLYWGLQFDKRIEGAKTTDAFGVTLITCTNEPADQDPSLVTRTKFFPQFYPGNFNFSVGNNQGVADVNGTILDCDRFNNNEFSLEKVRIKTGSNGDIADPEMWATASYIRDGNISSKYGLRPLKVEDLRTQGNRAFAQFTTFLQGGFNGADIFNSDKADLTTNACKREIDDSANQGGVKGPTVASYRKAIDIMGVKSDVEIKLLAIPSIRNASVTDYALDTIEDRFDALYVMDIEQRDGFNTVMTSSKDATTGLTIIPNVTYTTSGFASRALDNSFGAAYFPDVIIDIGDGVGERVAPPSVAVMGAIARGDNLSGKPYLAPAGFSRGTLDSSIIGLQVYPEREDLNKLYQERINPLAVFAGQEPCVWGQKTLQADASALDRINVRRLLIFIRRQVKAVANSLLFEPNREETLEKFNSLVKPIMQSVQNGGGVDRYKVIIDTTTTTQADVENNTIRGKIYLQPTRTAEFVALDFTVANASNFDSV